jgi:PAS domain S-box-containing protein
MNAPPDLPAPPAPADILASFPDSVLAADDAWRITHVNEAAERLWRAKAEKLVGRNLFEAFNPDGNDALRICCEASKRHGEAAALTTYSDVVRAWLELKGQPCAGGYTVAVHDVSMERDAHLASLERIRMREATHSINQRIFETTVDLILVVDRKGIILRVSPSSFAIVGFQSGDMIGRSAADFIHPDDLDSTREEMRLARRGELMRNFECRYVHKDGRVVPLAWTGVWSEPDEQHFFIGRDMTDRIAAEERLSRSQRLEAIGQLTGGIAHDFNNLLTVVIGSLDLLEDRVSNDPAGAEYARAALTAALRGAELTRQLLAFARRQSLDAKVIGINERVSATMGLLQRTIGEEIEIATTLAPDLWPAFVDPVQLESALINLAINARDAMPGGGRLTIETANTELDDDYARQNLDVAPGNYVMLAVSDTGSGMPPEVLARVFEPFFTTKEPGRGTGLGLSMVYGFARQSQGHVRIYSEVGYGTTVRLYVPRAASPERIAEQRPATVPSARPGERILVVEDNPAVRQVVVMQLTELGYDVIEAPNSESALAILKRGDAIDLVFTDVVMPGGMSGDALARAAQKLRPGLRVLLTSGFAKTQVEGRAPPEEFKHLLSKPYRKVDLAVKLRTLLDTGA